MHIHSSQYIYILHAWFAGRDVAKHTTRGKISWLTTYLEIKQFKMHVIVTCFTFHARVRLVINVFHRGPSPSRSVPEFLRKPLAICDLPGGGGSGTPAPPPPWICLCILYSWVIFLCFCCRLMTFFRNYFFQKESLRNTIRVSNGLNTDQDRRYDLGPNCLHRLSAKQTTLVGKELKITPTLTKCIFRNTLYCIIFKKNKKTTDLRILSQRDVQCKLDYQSLETVFFQHHVEQINVSWY